MKTLFLSIGLLGLSSCIKLQGYITSLPGLPIKGISLPDKAMYMATAAQPSYIPSAQYINPYSYIPQIPSIDYAQALKSISGVQNYQNNLATTNNQNVMVNTVATDHSNANTNMNNYAVSTSTNTGTVH